MIDSHSPGHLGDGQIEGFTPFLHAVDEDGVVEVVAQGRRIGHPVEFVGGFGLGLAIIEIIAQGAAPSEYQDGWFERMPQYRPDCSENWSGVVANLERG